MAVDLRAISLEIHSLAKAHRMPAPGATRLVKLIYLADLEWRRSHSGETLVHATWRFFHFGPYAHEFTTLLGSDDVEVIEQKGGGTFRRLQFSDDELQQSSVPTEVSRILDRLVAEWGDTDLNLLLDYVYFETEPMRSAKRGDRLDFSNLRPAAPETKPQKLDSLKLDLLRERLRQRTAVVGLSREPLKIAYSSRDAEAAWNEELKNSTLPSGLKFTLSAQ